MRKLILAVPLVLVASYFFKAEIGELTDDNVFIAADPELQSDSDRRPVEPSLASIPINSVKPGEARDSDPSNPLHVAVTESPGVTNLSPSIERIGPSETAGHVAATPAEPGERTAALQSLAEQNKAKLYAVLWQTIETWDEDDAEFGEFVLATFDELGDPAPGEMLAALVRTAPDPALRKGALRLLAQASQELTVKPFNQALDDPEADVRQSASAFFDDLGANALLYAVAGALMDRDKAVRLVAFSTLEEMHTFAPVWDVAELLVDDPDPQIRKRALELITYGGPEGAIDHLELALGDPNPQVSESAAALLTEYEEGSS